jgi:hypothetical protein
MIMHPVRARASVFSAALVLSAALVGCSSSGGTGTVTGSAPTCYGPVDNLTPVLTIDVRQGNKLITSGKFRSSAQSHRYHFTLAHGTYEIATAPGGKPIDVTVKAGHTVRADLPNVSCF